MTHKDFEWRRSIIAWMREYLLPSYVIVYTPFGFLEGIGQKIQSYPDFNFSNSNLTAEQMLNNVLKESKRFFKSQPYLSLQNLRQKAQEQWINTSKEQIVRSIYDDTIGRFCTTENAITDLYEYLAYDVLQTVDYLGETIKADSLILRETLHAISNGINVSPFRTMYRIYRGSHMATCREEKISKPQVFKFDSQDNLLDADWIQAATFGLMLDGAMRPIHVITSDPQEDVVNRICWAKSCWSTFLTDIIDPSRLEFAVPRPEMGTIYVTDSKSSSLGNRLEVSQMMLHGLNINRYVA